MFLAAASTPESPQRFRRWLVSKPLSFWIMTWFLIAGIGTDGDWSLFPWPGLVMGLAVERVMAVKGKIAAGWNFLFGDSGRAFGTLAVVLVLFLAVVPAKDYFRRVEALPERIPEVDPPARRRGDIAAPFSAGVASDLAAGIGSGGPLHNLSRGDERIFAGGCERPAVSAPSADSAFID